MSYLEIYNEKVSLLYACVIEDPVLSRSHRMKVDMNQFGCTCTYLEL